MLETAESTTAATEGEAIPALPERVTRWTLDRHYTALVDHLMGSSGPGAVSEAAKALMVAQARARLDAHSPDAPLPDEIVRFGEFEAKPEEPAREP